ncbi:putative serine protease HtrA [bioreactor metagenome]|uniref:Putative serine protease HtrA n=1 Tax=bioreactor metagenome TaxID=1076179 RepID=A0A644YYZ2_9ZZZZ
MAILKIDQNNLAPVELGDSDQLKVGQTVIAIGTALGEFRSTVTKGVISGLGRGITAGGVGVASEKLEGVIQTDAAINSGNSGGPLFNIMGQVIGVNVAVSQNAQNIGFALPINLVKNSVDNFRKTGEFDRPYLGVMYQTITENLALKNNLPIGSYIQSVASGSPAEKSGLKSGDVVVEIDKEKIMGDDKISIAKTISRKKIGDEVIIKLVRNGKYMEFVVKLEKKI